MKGFKIDYGPEGLYIVFDLKVRRIFQERPKKGEEPVDENGNVIKTPVDRKGYFPEDIAGTFGVPMEEVKREAEQLSMTSFISMEDFAAAADNQESGETPAIDEQDETEEVKPADDDVISPDDE